MRSRQHLSQIDQSLQKRRLLLKNEQYGLCASTCAVNALRVLLRKQGRDFSRPPAYYVARLIELVDEKTGDDARKGIHFHGLQIGLIELAKELDLPLDAQLEVGPRTTTTLEAADDEIVIVKQTDHAVILTGVGKSKEIYYFSDPNNPSQNRGTRQIHRVDEVLRLRLVTDPEELKARERIGTWSIVNGPEMEKDWLRYVRNVTRSKSGIQVELSQFPNFLGSYVPLSLISIEELRPVLSNSELQKFVGQRVLIVTPDLTMKDLEITGFSTVPTPEKPFGEMFYRIGIANGNFEYGSVPTEDIRSIVVGKNVNAAGN